METIMKLKDELTPMKSPMGVILFIVNIILPGIGTIINSFMGSKFNSTNCIVGLVQLLTCIIIIGWIWSIWWGIVMLQSEKK